MADQTSYRSPLELLADEQNTEADKLLAGQRATKPVAMADMSDAAPVEAPAPVKERTPSASRGSRRVDNYIPPEELRPVFEAAAQKYDVPVNVLMALGHQESRYNPKAIGTETEWGTAKGMMQYLDGTAKGLGINPFDPEQAIPAAAKQIRERLDKGATFEDAVMEHFAGPDRKLWGPKTAAYGKEVIDKAYKIGDLLMGSAHAAEVRNSVDVPKDWVPLTQEQAAEYETKQGNHFSAAMPREVYENTFRTNNPQASPETVESVMQQYDQQKAARGKQKVDAVGARFDALKSPEALFDARLNEKLAGDAQGIMPPLPGKAQAATVAPASTVPQSDGVLGDIGRNLKVGADIAAQDVRELVKHLPGGKYAVAGGDAIDRYFHPEVKDSGDLLDRDAQQMQESMTPEMQSALKKKWYDSDKGKLGDAWTDWRSYAGGIIQSLPEQALTMGPSMALAKAAYTAKVAAGATIAVASQTAAKTAMVAGALSEGALGGAQSAREVRHEVLNLKDDVLAQSDAYKSMLAQGMNAGEAKKALAEDLATRAFITSGVVTGMFGGMGDRVIAKLFTEQVGKGVVKRALSGFGKGAVAEGLFEELPQSAGQQIAQNEAVQQANPNKSLMDDVANQALGGAVQGGLQGGGMGGTAAAVNRNSEVHPAAEAAPAQAPVPPSQVPPVPAAAVPPAPTTSGPLTSAIEHTAETAPRVVVASPTGEVAPGTLQAYHEDDQGGFTAQIKGDDGQVYTLTEADGLQIAPVAPAPPGPLTAAVEDTAEVHAQAPAAPHEQALAEIEATKPPPPPAPPATPEEQYAGMDLPALRERLKYIAQQAKNSGGMNKMFMDHRKAVEKAITVKTDEAKAASKLAEEPLTAGPFDDMAAANKMALRVAEKSGVPQEVVEANGKFNLKPIGEQNADVGDAGDGRGRSDRNASEDGQAVGNRPIPAGDVLDGRPAAGEFDQAGKRRDAKGADDAGKPADTKPALKDPHDGRRFGSTEKALAYIAKHRLDKGYTVEQTGRARYEVKALAAQAAEPSGVEKRARAAAREEKLAQEIAKAQENAAARAAEKAAPPASEIDAAAHEADTIAEGSKVEASGAEYTYVKRNPDGTHRVRSETGEFDTAEGEVVTAIQEKANRQASGGKNTKTDFVNNFVAEKRSAQEARVKSATGAIEALDIKVPVGISKVTALQAKSRPTKAEKALLLTLKLAERDLETFIRGEDGERTIAGKVWDRLKEGDTTKPASEVVAKRSATVDSGEDGRITLNRREADGTELLPLNFDNKAQAEAARINWERGTASTEKPLSSQESDIDKAATDGYAAGKQGITTPPFELETTEQSDAWRIGNRRAREEQKVPDLAPKPATSPFKVGDEVHFSSGIYSNEKGGSAAGIVESISDKGRIVVRAENGAGYGVMPKDYDTLSAGAEQPKTETKARQPNGSDSKKAEHLFEKPKKAPAKGKAANAERARMLADYFTPGNVVKSYGGHDRVIAFDQNDDGGFGVTVHGVVKEGGEWVRAEGAAGRERTHATKPDERTLRAGPVERAPAVEQAAPEPESEAAAKPEYDDGADIPKAFFKKVKVPFDVWIQDEGKHETIQLEANEALASVREDIVNLRSLLDCMKG